MLHESSCLFAIGSINLQQMLCLLDVLNKQNHLYRQILLSHLFSLYHIIFFWRGRLQLHESGGHFD